MKNFTAIKLFLVYITILISNPIYSQMKEYGAGVVIFKTFDLEKGMALEDSEKYADIIDLKKYENAYDISCRDEKGNFTINLIRLENSDLEEYEYIDSQTGDKYVIKDLLDTPAKALDAINTKDLSSKGVSSQYRMMLRILIE